MPRSDEFAGRICADAGLLALVGARESVDALLWRRDVRASATDVVRDSVVRGARASAAIDGADIPSADDSPMGRVLACAQAVTESVPTLGEIWRRAPLQAIVALHTRAAAGFSSSEQLGRPRIDGEVDDPLNLGPVRAAGEVPLRLQRLARDLTAPTSAPALLVAAITHAELMTLRPFTHGSGLVARACVRLVMADRGVDPSLFSIPEYGMAELGRPAYVRALRSFALETPDGVGDYCTWFAEAVRRGAAAVRIPEGR